jgi:hypothetical protein
MERPVDLGNLLISRGIIENHGTGECIVEILTLYLGWYLRKLL